MKLATNLMHPMTIIGLLRKDNTDQWKDSVLDRFRENPAWLQTLTYTYDPKYTFGLKKFATELVEIQIRPYFLQDHLRQELTAMFHLLDKLFLRELTGNAAINAVDTFLSKTDCSTGQLLYWIIKGDLKCGIGKKTVSKKYGASVVWKPPYMGAVNFSPKKIQKLFKDSPAGVFVENKADGLYGAVIIDKETGVNYIESRQGLVIYGMDKIVNEAKQLTSNCSFVLNGEILLKGYDRAKANGIVNSIKKIREKESKGDRIVKERADFLKEHEMTLEEAQDLVYMQCWDLIPLKEYKLRIWNCPRNERLRLLKYVLGSSKIISVIVYIVAQTYEEAIAFFNKQLELGLEGVIVKTMDGIWKDSKPVYQVKMKIMFTSDLRIIGFNEGEKDTKLKGTLGSLTCQSENGKMVTKVGGFSEKQRFEIWANKDKYLNRIIEVKCNGLSKSANKDEWSMLYANAYKPNKELIFRDDKLEANTIDELIDIEEASKYGI